MSTSTIPYDPSLVLGMVVDPERIKMLQAIAELQKPVDSQRDLVNALIRQKLSLDMTIRELANIGATQEQLKELKQEIEQVLAQIVQAATQLGKNVIAAEKQIVAAKNQKPQTQIGSQIQSPIDFSASQWQEMPLGADTMNMDVQYFRNEEESDTDNSHAESISSYVGATVSSFIGASYGAQVSASANRAVNHATAKHNILGTIVICANCTLRTARVLWPISLDVENAIENYVAFSKKPWQYQNVNVISQMASRPVTSEEVAKGMPVITGASYGASFVGFIHFEQLDSTVSDQETEAAAFQARAQIEENLMLADEKGEFGIDAKASESAKSLLSKTNIQSHCSVITVGIIPSIKSNTVTTVIKKLDIDPKARMAELAAMQGANADSMTSLSAGAKNARAGAQFEASKSDYLNSALAAVADQDKQANQVIDMNSMMTAIDDFVAKVAEGKCGVPINYYLKYISEHSIAVAWMQKYYPEMLHKKPSEISGTPATT